MKNIIMGEYDFSAIREKDAFYIDKTRFLKEWWEQGDKVTLITRPRRFGKTLTISMVERFFSTEYANMPEIFEGLEIAQDQEFMKLQGTFPVIRLSFAGITPANFENAIQLIRNNIRNAYNKFDFLEYSEKLAKSERKIFGQYMYDVPASEAVQALERLAYFLFKHYGKGAIILLDEYDVPAQDAFFNGYWDKLMVGYRMLCENTFKTNMYQIKSIITGVSQVSKESIFSGMNNLTVASVASEEYADIFGFTEQEVFRALEEAGCWTAN